jgi:hypothetical protein
VRIKRTLDGAEINKIIWEFEAQKGVGAPAAGGLAQGRVGRKPLSRGM